MPGQCLQARCSPLRVPRRNQEPPNDRQGDRNEREEKERQGAQEIGEAAFVLVACRAGRLVAVPCGHSQRLARLLELLKLLDMLCRRALPFLLVAARRDVIAVIVAILNTVTFRAR